MPTNRDEALAATWEVMRQACNTLTEEIDQLTVQRDALATALKAQPTRRPAKREKAYTVSPEAVHKAEEALAHVQTANGQVFSINDLMPWADVSRDTLRKALSELAKRGTLEVVDPGGRGRAKTFRRPALEAELAETRAELERGKVG